MLIAGIVLTGISALVLAIMVGAVWRAMIELRQHGVKKGPSFDRKSLWILRGWAAALVVGVGLIALSFR